MSKNDVNVESFSESWNGCIFLDEECSIIKVNDSILKQCGYSAEELECLGLNLLFYNFTVETIRSIYDCFQCKQICQTISGDLMMKNGLSFAAEIEINCAVDNDKKSYWLTIHSKHINAASMDLLDHISA